MLKLRVPDNAKMVPVTADDLAWLEAMSKEVSIGQWFGPHGCGYECRAEFGSWGSVTVCVFGRGLNMSSAAKACAEKVRALIGEEEVFL